MRSAAEKLASDTQRFKWKERNGEARGETESRTLCECVCVYVCGARRGWDICAQRSALVSGRIGIGG